MKIWTITTSQQDDGTATMVYTSEAEVNAHRARIIAASWESWFGEDTLMPEDTDEAWEILSGQAGFCDTVSVTEHHIAASALPQTCGVDVPAACPFCGCTDISFHIQDDHLRWFECDWCQAVGPIEKPEADPPEGWNFRVQPSPDVVEAVRWGFLSAAPGEWRVSDIKRVTDAIIARLKGGAS